SILAAVAAATEVGLDLGKSAHLLAEMEVQLDDLEQISGDNDTTLLISGSTRTIKGFEHKLQELKEHPGRRILVTNGIREMGRFKQQVYQKLAEDISESAELLITADHYLY